MAVMLGQGVRNAVANTLPCGESINSVQCTVSIPGNNSSSATPISGYSGIGGSGGSSASGSGQTTSSPVQCVSVPLNNPAPTGAGPGQWEAQSCQAGSGGSAGLGGVNVVWVPSTPAAPPPPPPPSPSAVAQQAASELTLPNPDPQLNPQPFGLVNFPEWLWVSPSIWVPLTTSATACNVSGCVTASATATPLFTTWNTGDGQSLTCQGPGTVYNLSMAASGQSTYCSHTYLVSSLGEPSPDGNPNDAAFPITATITWSVTWSASGAASGAGTLADMTSTGTTSLKVMQAESVIG